MQLSEPLVHTYRVPGPDAGGGNIPHSRSYQYVPGLKDHKIPAENKGVSKLRCKLGKYPYICRKWLTKPFSSIEH
jgi:hypothetical protein